MAKTFSAEWLSQSFYSTRTDPRDVEACTRPSPSPMSHIGLRSEAASESILRVEMEEHATGSRNSSPNSSCGDLGLSGSDSEVGSDSKLGESALNRRMRTKFTPDQISRLERTFNTHRYLSVKQRRKTAEKLKLSDTQVKIWFQNRRMKLKREVQNMLAGFFAPTSLQPFYAAAPTVQHPSLHGQLPYPAQPLSLYDTRTFHAEYSSPNDPGLHF